MKPKKVCEISLKFQPLDIVTTHFHSFKPITRFSLYFPSFSLPPRLIILFLLKKLVGTSIQDWIENYVQGKESPPMIQVRLLKRKRRGVKVDLKLGGQWNVPSLVANGMFQNLVANGMWRKNALSPLPILPPTTYLNLQFFDLEVLLYHGSRLLLTPFLRFLRFINYDYASWCNKFFTPSLSIWFWLKIWFFSSVWNHGFAHGHILRAPSHTSKWRIAFGVISKFDPNVTYSWWKTRTLKVRAEVEPLQA